MKLISTLAHVCRAAVSWINTVWCRLGLQILLISVAMESYAADQGNQGFVGVKSNVTNQASAFSTIVQTVLAAGGVGIAAMGIWKLYQAGKSDQSREEVRTGWTLIGIGVLALSFWGLIYFFGGVIWGDGQAATQQQRSLMQQQ